MFSQRCGWSRQVLARRLLGLAVGLAMLMLLSLGPAAQADTSVGGPIIFDTTWTKAQSPYLVVANVEVWQGVTLTIEPGVVVKFQENKVLQVNGALVVHGTPDQRIVFTSARSSPAAGDWGNIQFTRDAVPTTIDTAGNYVSGSVLQYCVVEYGGAAADSAIEARSQWIDHCVVRNNRSRGIRAIGTADAPARITNSIISGNSKSYYGSYPYYGGGLHVSYGRVDGSTVSDNQSHDSDGGIYAMYSTINNNIVTGNVADDEGGGILSCFGDITDNTVSRLTGFQFIGREQE